MYIYCSTIFNQLLSFLPKNDFKSFVGQHKADKGIRKLTTWNQLTTLLFAQATGKQSLRDIEIGLSMHSNLWYHLGINTVAKSTLSDANNKRDSQVFEKLFYSLLNRCREISGERKFNFNNPLYSFDSTTINLCLSIFDWAKYTKTKGALKIHTLLDNRTTIPNFISISDGKKADITGLQEAKVILEAGSIMVFDRGYIDYGLWKKFDKNKIYFVTRERKNQNLFALGQHKKRKRRLEKNILADETVMYGDYNAMIKYPEVRLRRIKFYDEITKKVYTFLTNNFELKGNQIAAIYKDRWQIELFFKWIKQNLKIKTFLGTSKNAVMTQIWIAMIYYLLLAYIKFQVKYSKSLLFFTRIIKETLMLRKNLIDLLSLDIKSIGSLHKFDNHQASFW